MPFGLRQKIKKTISLRIAFLFCGTFAIGLACAFLVTYFELRYSLEKSSREVLLAKFQEAKTLLTTENIDGLNKFLSTEDSKVRNAHFMFRVFNENGETVYIKKSVQEKPFDFEAGFEKNYTLQHIGWHALPAINDEDKFNLYSEKIGSNYLQVGRSSEEREGILEEILANFAALEVLLMILSSVFGVWYSKKALAPLRDLLSTIKTVEKGDLSQRVALFKSEDELQEIGETFNRMLSRIENLILMMRESLDNVAHDIRTPLTRIHAIAEDALLSEDKNLLKVALEDCAESAIDISELVDQLLSISEAQAGTLALNYEVCDIKNLLGDVVDIYDFVAQEKEISIHISMNPEDIKWTLDRKRIKQVIGNLLDNAIKFTSSKTSIEITARYFNEGLQISVIDEGPGVPIEDIDRIWDRLYRSDKSRTTKGIGLGLSIVKSIVAAHGGSTQALIRSERGMEFSIFLPQKS